MSVLTADDVIRLLNLAPHPCEGGFFRETYRSRAALPAAAVGPEYAGPRSAGTAIYYLLTPNTFSEMHRLVGDEVFHFYLGDPVEMLQLPPDGPGRVVVLGSDLAAGQTPQTVVPAGVWQGSRLAAGGKFALLGCTVAPGFDYADYRAGRRAELTAARPQFAEMIAALTRG
jgi:hypothetical protein